MKIITKIVILITSFLLYLYEKKNIKSEEIWSKREMNLSTFLFLLSLLIVNGVIFNIVTEILLAIKGSKDIILPGTVEAVGTSPEKIIYAVVIGPIMEEILFRGYTLNTFRKKGNKLEAIIFTSVIFGLSHGNLGQAISATLGGLIFGYVAIEFGIVYSAIFHMLYNGMFYVNYFLHIDQFLNITSVLILFWCICNRKALLEKLKTNLNSETTYSIKRQFLYFLNPFIFAFCIVWIMLIVASI